MHTKSCLYKLAFSFKIRTSEHLQRTADRLHDLKTERLGKRKKSRNEHELSEFCLTVSTIHRIIPTSHLFQDNINLNIFTQKKNQ